MSKEKFEFKVIVYSRYLSEECTIYLFNKSSKIIVPISSIKSHGEFILMCQNFKDHQFRPFIHLNLYKILNFLNITIESIELYDYSDGLFYCYLNILHNKKQVSFNILPSDGICLSILSKKPLFVSNNVIKKVGIKVTPELLQLSLDRSIN